MTFKKVLSFFLTGATALSVTTTAFAADTEVVLPDDVSSQEWYAPAVRYVLEYDLMDVGTPDNGDVIFQPGRVISRQEVADAIYRSAKLFDEKLIADAAGMGIREMADYADIGQSYYDAMTFCFNSGILTGSGRKLNPGKSITRQEFATVLTRYMKLLEKYGLTETIPGDGMAARAFADGAQIQPWAADGVSFCLKNGLMRGTSANYFTPNGSITRAQLAQVLNNISPDAD